jgi:DNA invertase Pin-like site-specific DNA recombinase
MAANTTPTTTPRRSPTAVALYARVSTTDQHPEIQLHALRQYAERRGLVIAEEYVDAGVSGANDRRPALDALMEDAKLRRFDMLAITKLDRLARSVGHLTDLSRELAALGIDLVVLDQSIDTSTPAGRLLFNVLGSIAEFERDLIRERTLAGLRAARDRGVRLGRPTVLDHKKLKRVRRLRASGKSIRYIAGLLDVSVGTVHNVVAGSEAEATSS